jgi:ketosteroid isomerase-like protein
LDETSQFLSEVMPRLQTADTALHNGDAGPRMKMWSRKDPVTLLGAAFSGTGWAEIEPIFTHLAASLTACTSFEVEVVAAEAQGDLAYLVAFEHTTASLQDAGPQSYTLRVTTIFRREHGEWTIVHRHGNAVNGQDAVALLLQTQPNR